MREIRKSFQDEMHERFCVRATSDKIGNSCASFRKNGDER